MITLIVTYNNEMMWAGGCPISNKKVPIQSQQERYGNQVTMVFTSLILLTTVHNRAVLFNSIIIKKTRKLNSRVKE